MLLRIDSKHLEEQGTACVTANPGEDASTIEISIEYCFETEKYKV